MKLNAETIYGFTTSLLLSRFDNPKRTPDFHWELWDLVTRTDQYVAIAAPRGHAKSTAITHAFTLAALLFRERDFALILSDTEGQAVKFLADIKSELLENDNLSGAFGINRLIKDTESDIIVEFTDHKQFRIIAKGSEQKLRGLKWRNKRPNLVIGDDLENDEIVMNDERRAKFRNWFFNALLPVGSDDCWFRIVGTILHMDSLLERLMPPWGDKTTETNGLKHWSTHERPWLAIRYQAHNDDFSKILWEEKWPEERLKAERQMRIEQGIPESYSQEFLNYPIDEENAYFRKEDFLPIEDDSETLEYYVGGDLAISEKDTRAYSVFIVAGMNSAGILKIVDVRRFRGDSLEIIEEMFSIHQRYDPVAFFVEKENIMRSIGSVLFEKMRQKNVYLNIGEDTMIVPTQDKIKRAQSIRARARAGGLQVKTSAYWFDSLLTECLQFPRGIYKDQVDALAMLGLGLQKMLYAPTPEELDEEEWEDEFGESLYMWDHRDALTGY